jgi:copper chaperone
MSSADLRSGISPYKATPGGGVKVAGTSSHRLDGGAARRQSRSGPKEDATMTTLTIPDMTCGHCKRAVEGAIASVDAGARVRVDLDTKTVEVDSVAELSALLAALKDEGYEAAIA